MPTASQLLQALDLYTRDNKEASPGPRCGTAISEEASCPDPTSGITLGLEEEIKTVMMPLQMII